MNFWNDFWKVCQDELQNVSYAKLMVFSLIGAGLVHIGSLIYVRIKKQAIYFRTEVIIILLISYTIFIAQVTVLSRGFESKARVFDTKWLWFDTSMKQNMTNLLNIILFIPYGILITALRLHKKSLIRIITTISYCFLTSILIEYTQYITKRGYFEIDDLEANVIGGMGGSILLILCSSACKLLCLMRRCKDETQ